MAETVLKVMSDYFVDNTTTITAEKLESLKGKIQEADSEVIKIVVEQLQQNKSMDRLTLLKSILFYSEDENIKRATIQELVRMKTEEVRDILSSYLRTNKINTPSKVEAIRALGKDSIRRYLERKF
jgi:hypothetical protein